VSLGRRAAIVILALGLMVAGCAAASRIPALQPQAVPVGAKIALPRRPVQLGIDVDWYAWQGQNVGSTARTTAAYLEKLHANAVSISFPFFAEGEHSNAVLATAQTPTPAQLSVAIAAFQADGLTVSLRPLLDESSLGRSRVGWTPPDLSAWFNSYESFLRPYLQMAQSDGVAEFIVGTELTAFDTSPRWKGFDAQASKLYRGTLACAANWDPVPKRICGGLDETVDAYPPVRPGKTLLAAWDAYDRSLSKGTLLTEVGIAAAPDAPSMPWVHAWNIQKVDPAVQARWFTAACQAAVREHMGGIYFWSVGLGAPTRGPTLQNQLGWTGSAGADAIKACFASVTSGGRG
jgi:hypothetical protein